MYTRFTDEARTVMQVANREAMRFEQEYIGPEHVLLGLIDEETGDAAKALTALGLDLQKTRADTEELAQRRADTGGKKAVPVVRAKNIIEHAMHEAQSYAHDCVSSGHMLLALLRTDDAGTSKILTEQGVTLKTARDLLNRLCSYDCDLAEWDNGQGSLF